MAHPCRELAFVLAVGLPVYTPRGYVVTTMVKNLHMHRLKRQTWNPCDGVGFTNISVQQN